MSAVTKEAPIQAQNTQSAPQEQTAVKQTVGAITLMHKKITEFAKNTAEKAETATFDGVSKLLSKVLPKSVSLETRTSIASSVAKGVKNITHLALQLLHVAPYIAAAAAVKGMILLAYASPILSVSLLVGTLIILQLAITKQLVNSVESANEILMDKAESLENALQDTIADKADTLIQVLDLPSRALEMMKTPYHWVFSKEQ